MPEHHDHAGTRDPVRTRGAILDAAGRLIMAEGVRVSLEAVAREAGVSKGGLLHHFPSKDALFVGVAENLLDRFDAAVDAALDPDDHRPGRLVRAYVRASFADLEITDYARREATLMSALATIPDVVHRAQEDGRRWRDALAADGLDPGWAVLLVRAVDGTWAASLFEGRLDPEELAQMRDLILQLSHQHGPGAAAD